jgi:hypothetical protein
MTKAIQPVPSQAAQPIPTANPQSSIYPLGKPTKDGETRKYILHTFAFPWIFPIQHAYYQ